MRELKFRAWKMHNGKLRRCVFSPFDILDYAHRHPEAPVLHNQGLNDIRDFLPDADVIEQYTGLKDKNGREIYDGDIVRFYGRYISAITWDAVTASFQWFAIENIGDGYCSLSDFEKDFYEVIGTIHENPELLGGKE